MKKCIFCMSLLIYFFLNPLYGGIVNISPPVGATDIPPLMQVAVTFDNNIDTTYYSQAKSPYGYQNLGQPEIHLVSDEDHQQTSWKDLAMNADVSFIDEILIVTTTEELSLATTYDLVIENLEFNTDLGIVTIDTVIQGIFTTEDHMPKVIGGNFFKGLINCDELLKFYLAGDIDTVGIDMNNVIALKKITGSTIVLDSILAVTDTLGNSLIDSLGNYSDSIYVSREWVKLNTSDIGTDVSISQDKKCVIVDAVNGLEPGYDYIVDYDTKQFTGNSLHSLSKKFTVGNSVRLTVTPMNDVGDTLGYIRPYVGDVAFDFRVGDTVNISVPFKQNGYVFSHWQVGDSAVYDLLTHSKYSNLNRIRLLCPDVWRRIIDLYPIYKPSCLDSLKFAFNDTLVDSVNVIGKTGYSTNGASLFNRHSMSKREKVEIAIHTKNDDLIDTIKLPNGIKKIVQNGFVEIYLDELGDLCSGEKEIVVLSPEPPSPQTVCPDYYFNITLHWDEDIPLSIRQNYNLNTDVSVTTPSHSPSPSFIGNNGSKVITGQSPNPYTLNYSVSLNNSKLFISSYKSKSASGGSPTSYPLEGSVSFESPDLCEENLHLYVSVKKHTVHFDYVFQDGSFLPYVLNDDLNIDDYIDEYHKKDNNGFALNDGEGLPGTIEVSNLGTRLVAMSYRYEYYDGTTAMFEVDDTPLITDKVNYLDELEDPDIYDDDGGMILKYPVQLDDNDVSFIVDNDYRVIVEMKNESLVLERIGWMDNWASPEYIDPNEPGLINHIKWYSVPESSFDIPVFSTEYYQPIMELGNRIDRDGNKGMDWYQKIDNMNELRSPFRRWKADPTEVPSSYFEYSESTYAPARELTINQYVKEHQTMYSRMFFDFSHELKQYSAGRIGIEEQPNFLQFRHDNDPDEDKYRRRPDGKRPAYYRYYDELNPSFPNPYNLSGNGKIVDNIKNIYMLDLYTQPQSSSLIGSRIFPSNRVYNTYFGEYQIHIGSQIQRKSDDAYISNPTSRKYKFGSQYPKAIITALEYHVTKTGEHCALKKSWGKPDPFVTYYSQAYSSQYHYGTGVTPHQSKIDLYQRNGGHKEDASSNTRLKYRGNILYTSNLLPQSAIALGGIATDEGGIDFSFTSPLLDILNYFSDPTKAAKNLIPQRIGEYGIGSGGKESGGTPGTPGVEPPIFTPLDVFGHQSTQGININANLKEVKEKDPVWDLINGLFASSKNPTHQIASKVSKTIQEIVKGGGICPHGKMSQVGILTDVDYKFNPFEPSGIYVPYYLYGNNRLYSLDDWESLGESYKKTEVKMEWEHPIYSTWKVYNGSQQGPPFDFYSFYGGQVYRPSIQLKQGKGIFKFIYTLGDL
jgi:hypothetical protein